MNPVQLVKPSEALKSNTTFDTQSIFLSEQELIAQSVDIFHAVKFDYLHLLIPEGVLGEVVDDLGICSIPKASNILMGMSSLRGHIIPVFSMHTLLDMPVPEKRFRVMVIGEGKQRVAFAIDSLPSKIKLDSQEVSSRDAPLPEKLKPYVKRCVVRDDVYVEWDIFQFFRDVAQSV